MDVRPLIPHVVLAVLLAATPLVLQVAGRVEADMAMPVGPLPETAGPYRLHALRFCQDEACRREFTLDSLGSATVCPACGGRLDDRSLAERMALPPDVTVMKGRYAAPGGRTYHVSVVVTGRERSGIHKAQACMVGQGYAIANERVVEVIPGGQIGGKPFGLTVLDLTRHAGERAGGPDAAVAPRATYFYAYWFVGGGRETPRHLQRVLWTLWDGAVRGRSFRWAYIAVAGDRESGSDQHVAALRTFAAELAASLRPPQHTRRVSEAPSSAR